MAVGQPQAVVSTTVISHEHRPLPEYSSRLAIIFITIGVLSSAFVAAPGDGTIASALPNITADFQSLELIGWYHGSYFVAVTLSGTFYTFFNIKYGYLVALLVFEIGSVLCALAVKQSMLIAGLAVAGVGASALFSGGMIVLGLAVPLRIRPIFIALLSTMFAVWPLGGGLLGSAILDRLTWRWCFWINLPFGVVSFVSIFIFFKSPRLKDDSSTRGQKIAAMDLPGAFFLTSSTACLMLGLQRGSQIGSWSDPTVWGCLLGFGLGTVVFGGIEIWNGENSTFPTRLLKQRTVVAGCISTALLAAILSTHATYLGYFPELKSSNGDSYTIPYWVPAIVIAIVAGIINTQIGYYNPSVLIGGIILVIGCGIVSLLKVDDDMSTWIGYQLMAGIGAGACIQVPFLAVQVVLSAADMPKAVGMVTFFNTLGSIVSTPIADAIFSGSLSQQLQAKVPQLDPRVIMAVSPGEVQNVVPLQFLPPVLEAYDEALRRTLILPIVAACLSFLCSLAFQWRSTKHKRLA